MLNKLFYELFEKLKTEKDNDSDRKSGCFNFFVERILDEKYNLKNIVSSKTLTNYYNKYVEGKNNNSGEPKSDLKNSIAKYLGYNSYSDFEKENIQSSIKINLNQSIESNQEIKRKTLKKVVILVLCFFTLLFVLNKYYKTENCIIWNIDHFETSSCNTKDGINNNFYKINIENFKKVNVDNNTEFFKNGNPIIWYGKSPSGKIDFFTQRGIHPETLEELKPITEYIINKYVFSNNNDKTILE
ncbi:hypothetical protein [Polaribacter sp.]|uniref:hypothetical protein n=1 Tax=Polaribacter sp. TaxID=1920175 RepID=UPI003F6BCC6A